MAPNLEEEWLPDKLPKLEDLNEREILILVDQIQKIIATYTIISEIVILELLRQLEVDLLAGAVGTAALYIIVKFDAN